jgi:hypothetical protein
MKIDLNNLEKVSKKIRRNNYDYIKESLYNNNNIEEGLDFYLIYGFPDELEKLSPIIFNIKLPIINSMGFIK